MLRDLGAIDADGRLTDDRPARCAPCPCRRASPAWWSARPGAGRARAAADLAAVLVERGLGGDDADLDAPGRALRPRPRPAGRGHAPPRRRAGPGRRESFARAPEPARRALDLSEAGPLLALAYPDRVARARGRDGEFVMANGRAGARRPGLGAGARALPGGRRASPARAAAARASSPRPRSRWRRSRPLFGDASRRGTRSSSTARPGPCGPAPLRRLGAADLAERTLPVPADAGPPRPGARARARSGLDALPWTPAPRMARRACLPAARPRATTWPDLSDAALADDDRGLARARDRRPHGLDAITADDLGRRPPGAPALGPARRASTPRPRPMSRCRPARASPIDYEAEGGPVLAVRVQELFGLERHPTHRRRPRAAGPAPALAGLAADPDHARPAGLLARLLERRALRDARTLSAPPLARGPGRRPPTRRVKPRGT